jgi:hypothetical protein
VLWCVLSRWPVRLHVLLVIRRILRAHPLRPARHVNSSDRSRVRRSWDVTNRDKRNVHLMSILRMSSSAERLS